MKKLSFVEAYLSKEDLTGADLIGVNLAGAFFNQNQPPLGVNFEEFCYRLEDVVRDNTDCYSLVKENS